jgi:ACR3 family arsenite efflux pump ArsB
MFAGHGGIVLEHPVLFLRLVPPLLLFYVLSLALSQGVARVLGFPRERALALACTAMARNSPLVLPLAWVLFPEHPIIALSQVVEPLVEIPALILFSAAARGRVGSPRT